MATYDYLDNGKLHTRFSELVRCTPGQIERVVLDRLHGVDHTNEFMSFGTMRHEKFAEYLKAKSELPSVFKLDLKINPGWVEKSYEIEAFDNVVIHFTPDVHDKTWIGDLKTTSRTAESYKNNKQITFYAWVLGQMGLDITSAFYFLEFWNRERTGCQGYQVIKNEITPESKAQVKTWAIERIELLYSEIKKHNKEEVCQKA